MAANGPQQEPSFSESGDRLGGVEADPVAFHKKLTVAFIPHYHPFSREMVRRLDRDGVQGFLDLEPESLNEVVVEPEALDEGAPTWFEERYGPNKDVVVGRPLRVMDFDPSSAYGRYNWELFFHVPFLIGVQLSKAQRYEESRRWFHRIFDPTRTALSPTDVSSYWRFPVFSKANQTSTRELLLNLATAGDVELMDQTARALSRWQEEPFRPHAVARFRPAAYMTRTVMAYLDNLIAWGDSLFRLDTRETLNEAMQLYVLAAKLLGPRPQVIPQSSGKLPVTYERLRADGVFTTPASVRLEGDLPFDVFTYPQTVPEEARLRATRSLGRSLQFCVPPNPKLVGYWDTIADRFFKLRNSLNFDGTFRQLPLFAPPIDPGLLASAAAAGVDVAAAARGTLQPLTYVRFQVLVAKAAELAQEVKALGGALLSALEKRDAEALSLLRARQETVFLSLVEDVRKAQVEEAEKQLEGIWANVQSTFDRYNHYRRLLGDDALALPVSPSDGAEVPAVDPTAAPARAGATDAFESGHSHLLSGTEQLEIDSLRTSQAWIAASEWASTLGSTMHGLPKWQIGGLDGWKTEWGGDHLGHAISALASVLRNIGSRYATEASMLGREAGFERREQDWTLQRTLAARELNQLFKQYRAAQIRVEIAKKERDNHQQQVAHAAEVQTFLEGEVHPTAGRKVSTESLYLWMSRETRGLHAQAYELAYDLAKKAERALQHELGKPDAKFLQPSYLGGPEGLLAGEKLYLDVKRMELAYLEQNKREYELVKHVSLLQLDPLALVQLREKGKCSLRMPEEYFDVDGAGQYFRRLKTLSVTMPCVAGPNVSVSLRLTQTRSFIRKTSLVGEDYAHDRLGDNRFEEALGRGETIVTSSAVNDGGVFEFTLRDDRYLPFEGTGAISDWELELPEAQFSAFDYATISDVILHLRITAREGGTKLRQDAVASLGLKVGSPNAPGTTRLFSVRHEFPTEWAAFKASGATTEARGKLEFELTPAHYPYWLRSATTLHEVNMYVRAGGSVASYTDQEGGTALSFGDDSATGLKFATLPDADSALRTITRWFETTAIDDIYLAVTVTT